MRAKGERDGEVAGDDPALVATSLPTPADTMTPPALGSLDTVIAAGSDERPASSGASGADALGATHLASSLDATQVASEPGRGPSSERATPAKASAGRRRASAPERGDMLGRYLILDRLGAGGMGQVFAAYDPELDRRVALKLLHRRLSGSDTQGRSRLIREAQAMAKLAHPNVIAIFDVGSVDDQVFIAMELVEGETLSAWIERSRPAWPAIVEVFLAAGRGLAAAHSVGLIHRDFKPDNVLIGRDGRVRVGDFGLARRVSDEATLREPDPDPTISALTQSGPVGALTLPGSILGTPAYMAPEQHLGQEADARSDVFAFAVSLYQALYGRLPFEGETIGELVMATLHREPAPPSGGAAPAALWRIVRRGLAKEPDDRYPTIAALLAELAVDPRRRRRRVWLAAGGLALAAAIGGGYLQHQRSLVAACEREAEGLAGVWDDATKAELAAGLARIDRPFVADASARLLDHGDRYAAAWREQAAATCVALRIDDELDEEGYALERRCLEHQRARLGDLRELLRDADEEVAARGIDAVLGLRPPSECGELEAVAVSYRSVDDPGALEAVEAIRRELGRAEAHRLAGRYDDARALADGLAERAQATAFDPLIAEIAALRGDLARLADDEGAAALLHGALGAAIRAGHDRLAGSAATLLAADLTARDQHEEAARWLDLADAWLGDDGDLQRRLDALIWRARVLRNRGDHRASRALLDRGLELAAPLGRWSGPRIALLLERAQLSVDTLELATIQADASEALALFEEIYGPGHPVSANALAALGVAAHNRDQLDEAERLQRRALEIRRASLGERNQLVAQSLVNLANVRQDKGDNAGALELLDEARAIIVDVVGPTHSLIGKIENNRGSVLKQLGRHEEAIIALERALEVRREHPEGGIYAPLLNLAMIKYELTELLRCDGEALAASQRAEEAVTLAREAARDALAVRGPSHPHTGIANTSLGLTLASVGDHQGALAAFSRALAIVEEGLGARSSDAVFPHLGIGRALIELGRADEARAHLEEALAIGAFDGDEGLPQEIKFELARALWALGERPRALGLAREAAAHFVDEKCNSAREWLAEHDPERR